jgi:hypothetical protein
MFLDTDGNPIIIFLKPREVVHFVFTIASEVGETDTLDWQVLGGNRLIKDNVMASVTDSSNIGMTASTAMTQADNYWLGQYFNPTSGDEIGDLRLITAYDVADGASAELITLQAALSGTPTVGETASIYHLSQIVDGSGNITSETVQTEALPQNAEFGASGYPVLIPRAKSGGATDAHIALLTYTIDGVDA